MLIKSIELSNFRIFAGDQTVEFSTDCDKNVTVIMGDNGSGKTTFAQAFSWCLYGTTTFRNNDDLLSFTVRDSLEVGKIATVKVCLTLVHNGREYRVSRTQDYRKDSSTSFHSSGSVLRVSYKAPDGQEEFIENESEKKSLINEIVPSSISSYFFFDGERVERMGNEIQEGRSQEFKVAVDNLLGLSAISEALRHLKGGPNKVIGSYSNDYNANADTEYQRAEHEIQGAETRISKLEADIEGLEEDKRLTDERRRQYEHELERAKESKQWATERSTLEQEIKQAKEKQGQEIKRLTGVFGKNAWSFFAAPLLKSAVYAIDNSSIEIKEAPRNVDIDTINDIISRGECLCGTPIEPGSKAYASLISWKDIVPPEHIGTALRNYKEDCLPTIGEETDSESLLDDVIYFISSIREFDDEIFNKQQRVEQLSELLAGAEDMSQTEQLLQTARRRLREIDEDIQKKAQAKGQAEETLRRAVNTRDSLVTNDSTNKRVRRDKAYAEWIYAELNKEYKRQEADTRSDLEKAINDIFKEFFSGSLELSLDEKYNVTVKNRDADAQAYDVETSEGQTVAVIFAFIAGVIRVATDSKRRDDEMLLTEAYPLVMDAPMSKLDKKRIAAVCEVVPQIAEQVIIMIKDTDGELAREYLDSKVGYEYAVVSIEPERYSKIEKVEA